MVNRKITITVLFLTFLAISSFAQIAFDNPVMEGADPWVIRHTQPGQGEWYYYMHTTGKNLTIWKTKSLHQLSEASSKVVWEPPAEGPNSEAIWAPELHFLDDNRGNGRWYIYYTATNHADPGDHSRYVFVLENDSPDPLQGSWKDKGRVNTKFSGLDGSVFEYNGKRYFLYSGYVEHQSNLFISEMINPWTISEKQVEIARPTYDWEKYDGREICEGPQFLQGPKDKLFIVYSASACWDDDYCLGMLTVDKNEDFLDATAWNKSPTPVFEKAAERSVYGPGHNCFSQTLDGKEDLIVYHAKSVANQACRDRNVRIQAFQWSLEGTPDFGKPLSVE